MNFTPEQEAAITGDAPRLCVDAGAGSGKTRVLVERIVHLVEKRGVPLEQIAAITFTDKAASEMKARLRETFRSRARGAEDSPEQTTYWRGLEQRVDTARISTIHSFCTGFLREYALHIGLDPDFGVLGDAEAALLLSQTVRTALIGLLERQDDDALHLVAEYGTTLLRETLETMLRQAPLMAAALLRHNYTSPASLYRSWEAALAEEFKYRVRPEAVDDVLDTLHRFGGACTNDEDGREALRIKMIFVLGELRVCKDSKRARKLLEDLEYSNVRGKKSNWESEAAYKGISAAQDKVRGWARGLRALQPDPEADLPAARNACALHAVYGHTAAAWAAAKRQANALDFDALIQETLRVLRENGPVRTDAARALKHLLIDEFQDTDSVQLDIAHLLCGEPDGPHFFFVGDPKQSIYNFRGAEVELFGEQRTASAGQVTLQENFRSLPGVIGFINAFFDTSRLLRAVGDYRAMGHGRLSTSAGPLPARVEFLVVPEQDADGGKRNATAHRREEARWIAARIAAMCAPDAAPSIYENGPSAWRRARYSDFVLLFRATSNLYLYEEALRAAGVDFISSAGAGFYRRQEVLDVVNALRVTTTPQDAAALAAFLRGPLGGLSDDALVMLTEKRSLIDAFSGSNLPEGLAADDAVALAQARALISELRDRRHFEPAALLTYLYQRTGLEAVALDHHYGLQKASNLRKLLSLARDFSQQSRPPLDRFVRYLAEVAEHASLREGEALMQPFGGGAVSLMSIHKSKGLQFPVVFVCDMAMPPRRSQEKPLFVHRGLGMAVRGTNNVGETHRPAIARAIDLRNNDKDEAESARLLYVAMTRAQDYLFLCGREAPRVNSWFSALTEFAGVTPATGDGKVLGGAAWKTLVTRSVTEAPGTQAKPKAEGDVAAALARIARESDLPPTLAGSLSVSALLNLMTKTHNEVDNRDEEDDRAEEDHVAEDGVRAQHGGRAMARGNMVHRLFELWDFHDAPPVEAALDGAALGPRARREMAADLAAVAERFATLPVHAHLTLHAPEREVPFVLRLGETLLHGTIDAIAEGVLLDYKTGRFDPEKHVRYTQQLQLYAAAMAQMLAAPASALLVYLDVPREEPVDVSATSIATVLDRARAAIGIESD